MTLLSAAIDFIITSIIFGCYNICITHSSVFIQGFESKRTKKNIVKNFSISEIHGRKWYLKFYPFISFQMYILFNNEYFACKPFCWIFEPYTSGENAIKTHDHLMAIRPYPHKINDLFHNWRGKPLVNKYTETVESVALQCIFNP